MLMFMTTDTGMHIRREVMDIVTVDMDIVMGDIDTVMVDMDIVIDSRGSLQPRRELSTELISMPTGTTMTSMMTAPPCPASGLMP